MTVALATLVVPSTQPQAMANILSIAQSLGLSTSAWQPVGMARTILATVAQVVSNYSSVVSQIAQGGFLTYAAQMVDQNGNPITTWMDLVSTNMFNVPRIAATPASGNVPVTNTSNQPYPYVAGQLHFSNTATGATYTNTAAGTISTVGTSQIAVQADAAFVGTVGTSGSGVTLAMTTPLAGVTVSALAVSLVGTNAETNQALLTRCQAKLGSFSPNGAPGAYLFEVSSIPQGTPVLTPPYLPYAVSAVITRVQVAVNKNTGVVSVYAANANGPPPSGDITVANSAVQALVTPNAVTSQVVAASAVTISFSYTVYIPAVSGLTTSQVTTGVSTALANAFSTFPVGGVTGPTSNIMPLEFLTDSIRNAVAALSPLYAQFLDVTTSLTTDVSLGVGGVPQVGTLTPTVTFT